MDSHLPWFEVLAETQLELCERWDRVGRSWRCLVNGWIQNSRASPERTCLTRRGLLRLSSAQEDPGQFMGDFLFR